ncbi:MAG TPA: hypothetical protein PKD09_17015 [Aggregatilinea sp.]|uniref:hypothetical protein n=1 Tax=Aggregatilinea sp. TaxID=2806333 RepID=UPI002B8564B1|nr:hypothetical protein [Aggregatilinea sp.]HML23359.1 hypothetical protein [Aggregatilinea sp.]
MGFTVRKLQGEPIAIVTLALPIERYPSGPGMICHQLSQLAAREPGPLFAIFDMRGLEPSLSDVYLWLAEQKHGKQGSLTDARLRPILVGTHPMIPVAAKKIRQQLGIDVRCVPTMDEALATVRGQFASSAA